MSRTKNIIVSTPKKTTNSLFAFLILSFIIIMGSLILQDIHSNEEETHEADSTVITNSDDMATAMEEDGINDLVMVTDNSSGQNSVSIENETKQVASPVDISSDDNHRATISSEMLLSKDTYPRTAYLLYGDNNYQRLIRATYLTKNLNPDDSSAVRLTQQGSRIVGYDVSTNNKIANVKDISNEYQLYAARIVYSDKDNVIILSKDDASSGSVLYCVKGFDGKLIWAVLTSSLAGMDEEKLEAKPYKDGFLVKSGDTQIKITHEGHIIR